MNLINFSPIEFVNRINKGEKISNMIDENGKKMTDSYLVKKICENEGLEFIKELYEVGSGYIHLSNIITKSNSKIISESEQTLGTWIGLNDASILVEEKKAATIRMIQITNLIFQLIEIWKLHKSKTQ